MSLRDHYLDQPHEISLETLSLCNAACNFCPYPTLERKGTKLSDELIDKVIREMATFKTRFYFSPFKVNEPLLDVRLIDICKRVNAEVPLAILRIFTNGSPLTPQKIDELEPLENVVHLWISLNSHRQSEYERVMQLPWERTAKRLDYLHKRGFRWPVVLSAVGQSDAFIRYCNGRWPNFKAVVIKKDSWLGFTDAQETIVPDAPCGRWFELSITATGKVSHCCMDGESAYSIGDINTQSLLEIYNAPFWRDRREQMVSRKSLDDRSPCARCTY